MVRGVRGAILLLALAADVMPLWILVLVGVGAYLSMLRPHFLISLLLSWAGADWARLGGVAGTILKR